MPVKVSGDLEQGRLTGSRYYERWAVLRAQGVQPVILRRVQFPDLWLAWQRFYEVRGLRTPLGLMHDGRSEHCVPCLDPVDFEEVVVERRYRDD